MFIPFGKIINKVKLKSWISGRFVFAQKKTKKSNSKLVGDVGERFAVKYLMSKGYKIIECNWKCKYGEIDVIATDGKCLVFVEVKSRCNSSFAKERLFDTITKHKLKKLQLLAKVYIRLRFKFSDIPPHRVDVLGLILDPVRLKPLYYKLIQGVAFG